MTKIVDLAFVGFGYETQFPDCSDIYSHLSNIKEEYVECANGGEWIVVELSSGWFYYCYEGSEISGACRVIEDDQLNMYKSMEGDTDELERIVDGVKKLAGF